MYLLRFVAYFAIFALLTVLAVQFVEENYGGVQPLAKENPVAHYARKDVRPKIIDVTIDDLNRTISNWRFVPANFSESPLTLSQNSSGVPLRSALIELLSRNARDVSMEQYATTGKLLSVFTLESNGTVDYPAISPYDPFVFRVEKVKFSVPEVTFPPSADISVGGYREDDGRLTQRTRYVGYEIESVRECPFPDYCWEGKRLVVKFVREITLGGILVSSRDVSESFYFSLDDGKCKYHREGCESDDSVCISVKVCRKGEKYTARVYYYWFERDGSYRGDVKVFRVYFGGYHGESSVNLTARCNHRYEIDWRSEDTEYVSFTAQMVKRVVKDNYTWSSVLEVPVFKRGDTLARVSCSFYVDDVLVTPIGNVKRSYGGGSFFYYYTPGWCWGECHPPEEGVKTSDVRAPDHVKKPFEYDTENTTIPEEFLLRVYAETLRAKAGEHAESVLEKVEEARMWERFFGVENRSVARSVLEYFYLSQVPLYIEIDSKASLSRFQAFQEKRGNESVVSSLYTFFENTTFVRAESAEIPFSGVTEERKIVRTYLVLSLIYRTTFSPDSVETDCGNFAVAELAYYRQPGLQGVESVYRPPGAFTVHKGYSPVGGVEFHEEFRVCRTS